jgi:hypothetical protein
MCPSLLPSVPSHNNSCLLASKDQIREWKIHYHQNMFYVVRKMLSESVVLSGVWKERLILQILSLLMGALTVDSPYSISNCTTD